VKKPSPPHPPIARAEAKENKAIKKSVRRLNARLVRPMPNSGSRRPSSSGLFVVHDEAGLAAAVNGAVWTVMTTLFVVLPGVSEAGLKLVVAPSGRPLAENVMVLLNVPSGTMANTNEALWPGKMVADWVEPVVNPKSRTSCESAAELLLKKLLLPL